MIRVLVCEDEKPIARAIAKAIAQDERFSVDWMAYNGREAVQFLEQEVVDVAFLDINVPLLSGIEVLKYMRTLQMPTIAVMLTSYQEFSYAQEALRHRAMDYLLKPLDRESLQQTLNRIADTVHKTQLETQLHVQLPHLTDVAQNTTYYFGLLNLGNDALGELESPMQNGITQLETHLQEQLTLCFGEGNAFLTEGRMPYERALFLVSDIEGVMPRMQQLVHNLPQLPPLALRMGETSVAVADIPCLYKQYSTQLEAQLPFSNHLVCFSAMTSSVPQPSGQALEGLHATTTKSQAMQILLAQLQKIADKRRDYEYLVKLFFVKLCEKNAGKITYVDIENEILDLLNNTYTISQLMHKVAGMLDTYFFPEMQFATDKTTLARNMHAYLEAHYPEDISGAVLEKAMGYSEFYMRKVFKEAYGVSPNAYLTQIRIAHACELLQNDMQVKEVARAVGWQDPLYFSKVFKRVQGVSPSEYMTR